MIVRIIFIIVYLYKIVITIIAEGAQGTPECMCVKAHTHNLTSGNQPYILTWITSKNCDL